MLSLLDHIEQLDPTALDFQDKRYAAHVAAGQDLLAKGNTAAAIGELSKAQDIDPDRGEARAALVALTPTPTAGPVLPSANKPLPQFTGAVLNDVDRFWSRYFAERGGTYTPADRHWFDKGVSTPCGVSSPVGYVVAHETAHRAQHLVGTFQRARPSRSTSSSLS